MRRFRSLKLRPVLLVLATSLRDESVSRANEFEGVLCTEELVVIPTYPVQEPDPNPMFFENRVYQGSSGKVYPNPFTTTLTVHPQNPEMITQAIVEITTIQGQILQGYRVLFNWLSPQLFADLSSLSKGMYVVRITYNNKQSVHKIIKQ